MIISVQFIFALLALLIGFVAAAKNGKDVQAELNAKENKQIRTTQFALSQIDKAVSSSNSHQQNDPANFAKSYLEHAHRAADSNIAAQRQNVRNQIAKHGQGGSNSK
jgi:hypothetical protein